jgi:hypothetical protein
MKRTPLLWLALWVCWSMGAQAQGTTDLGRPPPSGLQNPVLPPPSGSQNPVLPPPSGQRYLPGIEGRFGEGERRKPRPTAPSGSGDGGSLGVLAPDSPAFAGEIVSRITEIAPAFRRCWNPPPMSGPQQGIFAIVRFSLRRDGSIFGEPRIRHIAGTADQDLRQRFTASVLAAMRECAPLRLSRSLGEGIAGRPFTIRFHGRAPSNERQI